MLVLFGLDVAFPPPIARAAAVSPVVEDRDGRWLRGFTTAEGRWRLAADVDRVDPRFIQALVAVEDERFWFHPGVDPIAVVRAAGSFVRAGEVASAPPRSQCSLRACWSRAPAISAPSSLK
jgi:penicillin-binding protein 1C